MKSLKIKVCGMRDPDNIRSVAALMPEYLGLIFFEGSARFAGHDFSPSCLKSLAPSVRATGVFVNADPAQIVEKIDFLGLQAVQLHGNEPPQLCRQLKTLRPGIEVIKAFQIGGDFDWTITAGYEPCCSLFLFDAPGPGHGGTGRQFEWSRLSACPASLPFLLSGGIGPTDAKQIRSFAACDERLYGVDLNSRFETAPGLKAASILKAFFEELRI